jgi:hypothetical protein
MTKTTTTESNIQNLQNLVSHFIRERSNLAVTEKILARDPLEEIRKAFKLFDEDGTGRISVRNLRHIAMELGENIDDDELRAMIDEFDLDGDGESIGVSLCFCVSSNFSQRARIYCNYDRSRSIGTVFLAFFIFAISVNKNIFEFSEIDKGINLSPSTMPLQFEAFLPLFIVGGALYAAGPLLDYTHRFFNNGKVF